MKSVFVVIAYQIHPFSSEVVHEIHETEESARIAAEELEEQLPKDKFKVEVEEFPVLNIDDVLV